jgi:hypothetical protein
MCSGLSTLRHQCVYAPVYSEDLCIGACLIFEAPVCEVACLIWGAPVWEALKPSSSELCDAVVVKKGGRVEL